MSDLLMIVPSRGRPKNMEELAYAWHQTVRGDSKLLGAIDSDDPELAAYERLRPTDPRHELRDWRQRLVIGPRERLGPTLNRLAVEHAPEHFAIGFMGDDHRPRTPGWDVAMIAVLREMGSGLVYGNDLLQGESLPTAVVMTSDIVLALGYMVPPGLVHMYLDNFWLGLGRSLKRLCYLPAVVIEHCHPLAGKAEWDAGYVEVNAAATYNADRVTLMNWLEHEEEAALERVRAAIAQGAPA